MVDFSNINTILFDMDGTLTDLGIRWWNPFHRAYAKIKQNYDPEIYQQKFENSVTEVIEIVTGNSRFLIYRVVWKVSRIMELSILETLRLVQILKNDPIAFKEIILIDGVEEIIQTLKKRNYKIAIVTSASNRTLKNAKKKYSIFNLFDEIITRDDVKKIKPDPEAILLACNRLNSKPSNTVMVGDFPQDILGGQAAGTSTIAVLGNNGKYTKPLLEKVKPSLIITSISELQDIFNIS